MPHTILSVCLHYFNSFSQYPNGVSAIIVSISQIPIFTDEEIDTPCCEIASRNSHTQQLGGFHSKHASAQLQSLRIFWRQMLVWESSQPFKIELCPHQSILPCLVCFQGHTHKLLLFFLGFTLPQTGCGHTAALGLRQHIQQRKQNRRERSPVSPS